jgi:hypothetical protein
MHVLADFMHSIFFRPTDTTKKRSALWIVLLTALLVSCGGNKTLAPLSSQQQVFPAIRGGSPVSADYFGMHLQCVTVSWCSTGTVPYPTGMKFSSIRLWDSAYWGSIEPGRDVYNWGELDSLIGAATANGVSDFIFTFGNPPTWALNPDGSVNQGDADEFLTTLVRRECGTIQYYETWNEANLPSSWTGTQTQLITLAQHFYQIVRANCPAAKVLTPSVNTLTYADSRMWLQWWLQQGIPYDIIAFHGYTQPEAIQDDMRWLRGIVGLSVEVWDTEGSWGKEGTLTEAQEANWLMRAYIMQAASGVSRFYWYAYGSCSWGSLYGPSCGASPDHQQGMREAGIAYGTVSKWLLGATIGACSSDDEQTWSCTLTRPNGYEGVILWNMSSSMKVQIPAKSFVQYRDWQNTENPLGTKVNVSPVPILIENKNAS